MKEVNINVSLAEAKEGEAIDNNTSSAGDNSNERKAQRTFKLNQWRYICLQR